MTKQRFFGGQRQYCFQFQLRFSPFEHKHAVVVEHTEALAETHGQLRLTVSVEATELFVKVSRFASPNQVRRVEDHKAKRLVRERHLGEIADDVGMHDAQLPVCQGTFLVADVHEVDQRIVFIEPEHTAAAAGIQNWSSVRDHGFVFVRFAVSASRARTWGTRASGGGRRIHARSWGRWWVFRGS